MFAGIMVKSTVDQLRVIDLLMEQKDATRAIEDLLFQLKDKTPKQIQRAFINIRAKLLRNKRYRDEETYQDLLRFCATYDTENEADLHLLENVIPRMTTSNVHWLQQVGYNVIQDPDLYVAIHGFKIMKDPFYSFDCPHHIKNASKIQHQQDIERHNRHQKEDRALYHLSVEDIDAMVKTAHDYIAREDLNWNSRGNHIRLLEALCLVTGRRKWELCCTLQMRSSRDSDYQAEVSGICKHLDKTPQWVVIPLLLPIAEVAKGIVNLRKFTKMIKGRYNGPSLFDRRMTHTHFRNVFADQAFRERETKNLFCINDRSVGPVMWKSLALAIKLKTAAEHYSAMCTDHVAIDYNYNTKNDD